MSDEILDDFRDVSGWSAVASGQAQLGLGRDTGPNGSALRLDYDFRGGGGFVVARKLFARRMPESWAIELQIRGAAPANRLEIKLADPTGRNVWWWHRDAFEFPHAWAAAAHPELGGRRSRGGLQAAARSASSVRSRSRSPPGPAAPARYQWRACVSRIFRSPDHRTCARRARHPVTRRRTRSTRRPQRAGAVCRARPQWIALDFGREYEYGGIVVDWEPGAEARAFDVQSSADGARWTTLWSARQAEGERSYVYLPGGGHSRHLRLHLLEAAEGADGVRDPHAGRPSLRVLAVARRRSSTPSRRPSRAVILRAGCTASSPTGRRSASRGASSAAIMNEEGMLEPDRGSPSLEPFLYVDGALVTWADVEPAIALAHDCLPIPSSTWRHRGLVLTTTAFAVADPTGPVARAWYRVVNEETTPKRVRLFVALRPFQVTPPWQSFEGLGGPARVRALSWRGGAVVVDDDWRVVPLTPPSGFGAAAFEQGGVLRHLVRGELPPRTEVEDAFGYASGALAWDLELAPGAARDVHVAVPFADRPALGPVTQAEVPVASLTTLDDVTRYWERKLGRGRPSPARERGRVCGHGSHRDRTHPGQSRRPGDPARPASLHAVVDSRRRDHVRRAAADGLYRRGARLPRLVRAVSGPRRKRALRGRPQGRRLAAGAR